MIEFALNAGLVLVLVVPALAVIVAIFGDPGSGR